MSITLNWDKAGVEYFCSDTVTFDDVKRADETVFNDERFDAIDYVFINALNINTVTLSKLDIQIDVANDFSHSFKNENLKMAFIANKPHIRKVAEYYVTLFRQRHIDWQVAVFVSLEEARHWVS
ncbi:hypothetical protein [Thalassotalea sediminis]|uniref:hypothetical protein n=1 Tax=Thalassotalea sediminis TaxID=1759089 RepID=UPI00257439DB|nr:hypothetical protein [Thalassotalea sediminis]